MKKNIYTIGLCLILTAGCGASASVPPSEDIMKAADTNSNGKFETTELKCFFSNANSTTQPFTAAQITTADVNKDGSLDRNELTVLLTSTPGGWGWAKCN